MMRDPPTTHHRVLSGGSQAMPVVQGVCQVQAHGHRRKAEWPTVVDHWPRLVKANDFCSLASVAACDY